MQTTQISPQPVLQFSTRTTLPQLSQYAFTIFQRLNEEAARLGLTVTGPVQWIYTDADGKPETEFQLDIVLPVDRDFDQASNVFTLTKLPAFHCVTTRYVGGWEGISGAYETLIADLTAAGLTMTGVSREIYPTPTETDPSKHITDIQIGINP